MHGPALPCTALKPCSHAPHQTQLPADHLRVFLVPVLCSEGEGRCKPVWQACKSTSKPGQCCMWPLFAQAASGWSAMPAALCKAHWLSDCQSPPQMGVGSTRRNCRGNLTVANCAPFAIVEDLHPATGGVGSVDQPHLLCQRRRWRERRLWGPRRRRRRTKRRRGRRRGRIGLRSWRAGKGGGGAERG